ncbi:MAG: 3-keto-5-aminohexanoate cleavage protein [Sphingomonas sp.]|uniref:3-keto-5-aminohexanoate cleavage protein n=1 Tax=Sphingomonas sp. TaxID=28214 RepID=UPI00261435F2|nr:3-keto-5-aminohexanoate cleavage protein [Sphingomonas sp.]MDK2766097.1 3-keto-5-aminohexanoate cleavage protein [Sphingomonas sp.]
MSKIIVTCAVTGAIHTPTMSDALPFTPEDIANQAVAAADAGAAILHLHARNPRDGSVSINPDDFVATLSAIRQRTDAIINISTGGSLLNSIDERIAPALRFSPEMCSLNMGSINFSFHPLAKRYSEWKYEWERSYVENSDSYIFRNTFRDIVYAATQLGDHNIRFEHECYDLGHLYNLKFLYDAGVFKAPLFIQFIFGILGGMGADIENLQFIKHTADKLFGSDYRWSVLGAGVSQMAFAAQASRMGGHVRVGLEDSLFIEKGVLARSNAEQVDKVRSILKGNGHQLASPAEAREILALKGAEQTSF